MHSNATDGEGLPENARFLCANARRFGAMSTGNRSVTPEMGFYFLAISIELTLKAYLQFAGMTDDQTRRVLGHDLEKATLYARTCGLGNPPPGYDRLLSLVHPHYASGGFRRGGQSEWPSEFLEEARAIAESLNSRVNEVICCRVESVR